MERGAPQRQGENVTSRAKEIAIGAAETAGGLLIAWATSKYATHFKEPMGTGILALTDIAFFTTAGKHFIEAHKLKPKNSDQSQILDNAILSTSNPFGWEI